MDINKIKCLCPGCMKIRRPGARTCEWCGFDERRYTPPQDCLAPGTILNGIFYVGRVIGSGGFANTYVAYNLNLERICAIKEFYIRSGGMYRKTEHSSEVSYIHGDLSHERMLRINFQKFEQEARILASIGRMPGVVTIHSLFYENNTCYIEEEFILGERLKDYVGRYGGISFPLLIEKLAPMMESIESLHQRGIFHRDISPDNIMLRYAAADNRALEAAELVLIDFGAAKQQGMGEHSTMVLRKKGYSSLEQLSGTVEANATMDVYSLAATIYYCICGKAPSDVGERVSGPVDTLILPARLGADLSEGQQEVLLKGLSITARDRYSSMAEFLLALQDVLVPGIVKPKPKPPSPPPVPTPPPPAPWGMAARIIALILIGCLAALIAWHVLHPPDIDPGDGIDETTETQEETTETPLSDSTAEEEMTETPLSDITVVEDLDGSLERAEIEPGTYWITDPDHPDRVMSVKNNSSMYGAYMTLREGDFKNPDMYQLFDIVKDEPSGKYLLLCHFSNPHPAVPTGSQAQVLHAAADTDEQKTTVCQEAFDETYDQYWDILEDGEGRIYFRSAYETWISKPEPDSKKMRLTESDTGWLKAWELRIWDNKETAVPQENEKGNKIIQNGYYKIYSVLDKEKTLQSVEGAGAEEAALELRGTDGGENSVFYVERRPDGYYSIVNSASEKALSIENDSAESGTGVQEKPYTGSDGQKWVFIETTDDQYNICSIMGTALDLTGGSTKDGTGIRMIEPNSGDNQKWELREVLQSGDEFEASVEEVVVIPPSTDGSNTGQKSEPPSASLPETGVQPVEESNSSKINNNNQASYYIIPDSDSRYLSVSELTKYDMSTLRLARNEIYARKGRRFKAADLQAYFDAQPWYYGYIDPAAFDSQEKVYLNQYELANARLILKYEKGEIHA